MKGKKCIKLVILFITFLLSLSLSLNASAIRKNVYGNRIFNVSYATQHPDGTITDLALISGTYHPLTNVTINANDVFNISRFKGKFGTTYNVKKNKKWSYEISIIVGYKNLAGQGYEGSPIPQAQCPLGDSQWIIDNCQITIENFDGNPYNIYSAGQNVPISDAGELLLSSYEYNRWVIKLDGHWRGNDQNKDYFETIGVLLSIYNPSPLSQTIQYSFAMPTFYFYDEEESAEEEVAQKELEDRDNIESQSSTTENQANNAGNAAQTTGTTLFGAFSQLFTALTNVNGNSCTLPNMQVYSLNLGQMNLCTYDIPPQIMALVSIGMVFIIVPLGIHLVKKMISLYKEITG